MSSENSRVNNSSEKSNQDNADIVKNKNVAALSYVWILCLVPFLGRRDSKFAQFHSKQGLVLFSVEIIAGFFAWFPVLGQLLMIGILIISVIGIVKTLNGEWWKIPYLYGLSKKINL